MYLESRYPSKGVLWVCKASVGRGKGADAIFGCAFPDISTNSGAIFGDKNAETHPDVAYVLREKGIRTRILPAISLLSCFKKGLVTPHTDLVFLLANAVVLNLFVPRQIIETARTATAIEIGDPSSARHSFRGAISKMCDQINALIHIDLPPVLEKAHEGKHVGTIIRGVSYPFGLEPYTKMKTDYVINLT